MLLLAILSAALVIVINVLKMNLFCTVYVNFIELLFTLIVEPENSGKTNTIKAINLVNFFWGMGIPLVSYLG